MNKVESHDPAISSRAEPKTTVWTEGGRSFLGWSNKETGVGFAFMDQKRRTKKSAKKEFSDAPLYFVVKNKSESLKTNAWPCYFPLPWRRFCLS